MTGPIGGGAFEGQCIGSTSPSLCCTGFLTGAACAGAGGGMGDPAGANFIAKPGQSQSGLDTFITGFSISRVFAPTFGTNATTPTFATQDLKVLEMPDTDGDGFLDHVDNCPFVSNASQSGVGGKGTAFVPDGIGDACQCGHVNNDGRVTTGDATILARALLTPPMTCGATVGAGDCAGGFKCDVNKSATCTTGDATIVARALRTPPTATINSGCGPAPIVP